MTLVQLQRAIQKLMETDDEMYQKLQVGGWGGVGWVGGWVCVWGRGGMGGAEVDGNMLPGA
jgi:hypothetical protein